MSLTLQNHGILLKCSKTGPYTLNGPLVLIKRQTNEYCQNKTVQLSNC